MSGRNKASKGLGKGGTKCYLKVPHDNIQGITKPAIHHLGSPMKIGDARCKWRTCGRVPLPAVSTPRGCLWQALVWLLLWRAGVVHCMASVAKFMLFQVVKVIKVKKSLINVIAFQSTDTAVSDIDWQLEEQGHSPSAPLWTKMRWYLGSSFLFLLNNVPRTV